MCIYLLPQQGLWMLFPMTGKYLWILALFFVAPNLRAQTNNSDAWPLAPSNQTCHFPSLVDENSGNSWTEESSHFPVIEEQRTKPDSAVLARYSYHWVLYYDFYSTLSAFHYLNSNSATEVNNIYFYYTIDVKSNLCVRQLKWDFYLFNDYGLRHFIDSITQKTQDQLTWKNSLYYPLYKKKLHVSLHAQTQTKLWNTYEYRSTNSAAMERYLYDAYMSPGIITYSGGLTYEGPGNSVLQLGLGSSKVTKIKRQEIFESRQETKISGLDKGQRKKSEWGLNLTATVPMQKFHRMLRWEFFGAAFAPARELKNTDCYTLDINQVLHVILLKYMRLSFRTKVSYNRDLYPKPRMQNQISLGFYLSNQL